MNSTEQIKNRFNFFKLAEKIENLNTIKCRAIAKISKINKIYEIVVIILPILIFVAVVLMVSPYSSWLFSPLISTLILSILISSVETKVENYVKAKSGYQYYKNELIEQLKLKTVQFDIISYFNSLQEKNEQLESFNKQLKIAFINENYNDVVKLIETMISIVKEHSDLSVSKNMEKDKINLEKDKIKEYELSLGTIEKELEVSSNLKKYL